MDDRFGNRPSFQAILRSTPIASKMVAVLVTGASLFSFTPALAQTCGCTQLNGNVDGNVSFFGNIPANAAVLKVIAGAVNTVNNLGDAISIDISGGGSGATGRAIVASTNVANADGANIAATGTGTGNGVVGLFGSATVDRNRSTDGVYGASSANVGVFGLTTAPTPTNGVAGMNLTNHGSGVYGENDTGDGVGTAGRILTNGVVGGVGTAILGDNPSSSGWSGVFTGRVQIATCLQLNGNNMGNCGSDSRLKKNIQPIVGALDEIMRLRPVTYEWKDAQAEGNRPGTRWGFIAQEVEKVIPQWVGQDDRGFKTLDTAGLVPMLVQSVQTLKTQNDELRERLQALEARRRPLALGLGDGWTAAAALCFVGGLVLATRRRRSKTD